MLTATPLGGAGGEDLVKGGGDVLGGALPYCSGLIVVVGENDSAKS